MNKLSLSEQVVHLIGSHALLSSGNATFQDGVAAVECLAKHYSANDPFLVLHNLDKDTAFPQMHPAGWAVNRYILHDLFGASFFLSPPSLLVQNSLDYNVSKRDLTPLQSTDFKFLLTNAAVPSSNSWHFFMETVHFHNDTGLAIIVINDPGDPLTLPQVEATQGALNYIRRLNQANPKCNLPPLSSMDEYIQFFPSNSTQDSRNEHSKPCWTPVVYYADIKQNYDKFRIEMDAMNEPPALLIDPNGHDQAALESPKQLPNGMWVSSYDKDPSLYVHHTLVRDTTSSTLVRVERIQSELSTLPPQAMADPVYKLRVAQIYALTEEADQNDPVIGQLGNHSMPIQRDGKTYFRCKAGECEMGNLFTDALRWHTEADFAFYSTGGLRGGGWAAEQAIRVSEIWQAMPFPNSICTGILSGLSIYQLMHFSINTATFQAHGTELGSRLLQVSGARIVYNTQSEENKLVSIEIYNRTTESFEPLERLKLYSFATDSYLCGGQKDFSQLTGPSFSLKGEVPGTIDDTILQQEVVARYLASLDEPYEPVLEGRLVNDTSAVAPLELIQDEESCEPGATYWQPDIFSCTPCPYVTHLQFSDELLHFETQADATETSELTSRIVLVNREVFRVRVRPKQIPTWLQVQAQEDSQGRTQIAEFDGSINLNAGESIALLVQLSKESLEHNWSRGKTVSEALGTVSFGTLGLDYPGCLSQDATFDVSLRITPSVYNHQLGSIRAVGFSFMSIILLTSGCFAVWVTRNRNKPTVVTMQPNFLVALCSGIFMIALTIIPLSLDDEVLTHHGCDIACMASPWCLCLGLTVAFSALISKLWRVNKIFGAQSHRRVTVRERDALAPFLLLSLANVTLLLVWTLVDPLRWERRGMENESWNTYGSCSTGKAGKGIFGALVAVNIGALLFLCLQAYKARNINGALSESKPIGIAIFSWLQVVLVGLPVLLLLRDENPRIRYFVSIALLFVLTMSMLLLIFCPLIMQHKQAATDRGFRLSSVQLVGPSSFLQPRPLNFTPEISSDAHTSSFSTRGIQVEPGTVTSDPKISVKTAKTDLEA